MTAKPLVEPLSHGRRKVIFLIFLAAFVIALPAVVFYANGYRFDFSQNRTQIVSTGGLFIGVTANDAQVYVDDELKRDLRIFQQGTYVQNLEAGLHQIHVQQDGLETWVKQLPVRPFIVTEVRSFLMPKVPQVRLISQYENSAGTAIVEVKSTSTPILPHASSTNEIIATTSINIDLLRLNPEYIAVLDLFASNSEVSATFLGRIADEIEGVFELGQATSTATSTRELQDMQLFERDGEVFARWVGPSRDIPGYFCALYTDAETTAIEYGAHVARAIKEDTGTSTQNTASQRDNVCRSEIRIDRKQQQVQFFDFVPGRNDLVLMHLADGLYVVEVDDRGWQNTQVLYPGADIDVRVDGNRIYVRDGEHLLEVFTELTT